MNNNIDFSLIEFDADTNPKKCMLCGKCSAVCPSFNEMEIKPHQFVNYISKRKFDKLINTKSFYSCLNCLSCVEHCPRGIKIANLIEVVNDYCSSKTLVDINELSKKINEDIFMC